MLIRSLTFVLILTSSLLLVHGQTPDALKANAEKAAKAPEGTGIKARDLPFPGGIDLQFLIKEMARDLDLNVLFDPESFRGPRKTSIELKNVTMSEALDYLLLQEGLFFEEVGPRTILVSSRSRGTSVPQIGVGTTPLTQQLARYFGVDGGILINSVRPNSPASKAGLTAGDVIVEVDGVSIRGALGLVQVIQDKSEGDVILTIVRNRKRDTISVTPQKGVKIVS